MASDTSLAPIPLIYCSGSGDEVRGELQDHIVSISSHPSRDLLGVGDIVGNITLYVSGSFYFYDLYLISLWPAGRACRYSYRAGEQCSKVTSVSPQSGYSCRVLNFSKTGHSEFQARLCVLLRLNHHCDRDIFWVQQKGGTVLYWHRDWSCYPLHQGSPVCRTQCTWLC